MNNVFSCIRERQSTRVLYDAGRPVSREDVAKILEAATWAPTAHNMQNFEIVIDDKKTLARSGAIPTRAFLDFIRENYDQLSFSEEELKRKKTGLLGLMFPPAWRDPKGLDLEKIEKDSPGTLDDTMHGGPTLFLVLYDPHRQAPASKGDVLGFISLGCPGYPGTYNTKY